MDEVDFNISGISCFPPTFHVSSIREEEGEQEEFNEEEKEILKVLHDTRFKC